MHYVKYFSLLFAIKTKSLKQINTASKVVQVPSYKLGCRRFGPVPADKVVSGVVTISGRAEG